MQSAHDEKDAIKFIGWVVFLGVIFLICHRYKNTETNAQLPVKPKTIVVDSSLGKEK